MRYNYFSSLLNLSRSLEKNVKVITNIQEGLSLLKDSFSNNQINIVLLRRVGSSFFKRNIDIKKITDIINKI